MKQTVASMIINERTSERLCVIWMDGWMVERQRTMHLVATLLEDLDRERLVHLAISIRLILIGIHHRQAKQQANVAECRSLASPMDTLAKVQSEETYMSGEI